jgi:hypothetical protein
MKSDCPALIGTGAGAAVRFLACQSARPAAEGGQICNTNGSASLPRPIRESGSRSQNNWRQMASPYWLEPAIFNAARARPRRSGRAPSLSSSTPPIGSRSQLRRNTSASSLAASTCSSTTRPSQIPERAACPFRSTRRSLLPAIRRSMRSLQCRRPICSLYSRFTGQCFRSCANLRMHVLSTYRVEFVSRRRTQTQRIPTALSTALCTLRPRRLSTPSRWP